MKSRKTTSVLSILDGVNAYLASDYSTPESRVGAAVMLHSVLHDTGNYDGFTYLNPQGMIHNPKFEAGSSHPDKSNPWIVVDDSRRCYYINPNLRK